MENNTPRASAPRLVWTMRELVCGEGFLLSMRAHPDSRND